LEVLSLLVETFEREHYPIPTPDPISAIEHYMESRGLTRKDLEPFIGSRARVSEVMTRRRPLTLGMTVGLPQACGSPLTYSSSPTHCLQTAISSTLSFSEPSLT
jgi:HTH-type transcriptional regulator / antitoxin HigA